MACRAPSPSCAAGVAAADPAFTSTHAVTGLAALNADGTAVIDDVSCFSNGNCGAIGTYTDSSRHIQGFVANEVAGTWGSAEPIPGLAALNAGDTVSNFVSISCTAGERVHGRRLYTDSNQLTGVPGRRGPGAVELGDRDCRAAGRCPWGFPRR